MAHMKRTTDYLHSFRYKLSENWLGWLCIFLLTVFSMLLVSLYAGMVVYSFSDLRGGVPAGFTFEHWRFLFEKNVVIDTYQYPSIWSILLSTLLIAVGSMVVEVSISLFSGYALSKGNFPGKHFLIQSTLFTRAFPAVTSLIASFYILKTVGLLNTYTGIILIKGLAEVGMSTWIIKGFFDELPRDIDWAASVDGSSKWRTFFRIYVPAIWPGIAAISLFAFLNGWGEYVLVSVLTFDDAKVTFPIILNTLMDNESTSAVSYGTIMAIATFYMLPALILYFFSQKYIARMKI